MSRPGNNNSTFESAGGQEFNLLSAACIGKGARGKDVGRPSASGKGVRERGSGRPSALAKGVRERYATSWGHAILFIAIHNLRHMAVDVERTIGLTNATY